MERTIIQATVFDDGYFTPIKLFQRYARRDYLKAEDQPREEQVLFYFLDRIVAPSRLSGDTLLVHETIDQSREPRRAWVYQKAFKRVRRTPIAHYDTPAPHSYGMRTADSYDMFNGSPDKYDWHYHGKQELYIPYNSYKLASNNLTYEEILAPSTINPELTRWELHRVHKIEGKLKSGERHIYAKRIFYLDEDSWTIVLGEMYDGHGKLWRASEGHLMNYYDKSLPYYAMEVTYDLMDKRYNAFGLLNEETNAYTFNKKFSKSDFTPSALRRDSRG